MEPKRTAMTLEKCTCRMKGEMDTYPRYEYLHEGKGWQEKEMNRKREREREMVDE